MNIEECFIRIKWMDKVKFTMLMDRVLKENLKEIKSMALEFTLIEKVLITKGFGMKGNVANSEL